MKTEVIGEIGVDAGHIWIGDPCYIFHRDSPPKSIGKSWSDFCSALFDHPNKWVTQFSFDAGHKGMGICVNTGGDGVFPVYAERDANGEIVRVVIEFEEPFAEFEDLVFDEEDEG